MIRKMLLIVPLCICVVYSMMLSGCSSDDFIPAIIEYVQANGDPGELCEFMFSYADSVPQRTVTFVVQYQKEGNSSWTEATILNNDDLNSADLTNKDSGIYYYRWNYTDDGVTRGLRYKLRITALTIINSSVNESGYITIPNPA
jgi:hypothetical protein